MMACILSRVQDLPYTSAVKTFFCEFDINMDNFEAAINAMALVDALLITIPFSVLPNLSMDYYDGLAESLLECKKACLFARSQGFASISLILLLLRSKKK